MVKRRMILLPLVTVVLILAALMWLSRDFMPPAPGNLTFPRGWGH